MVDEIKRNEAGEELTDSGFLMYPKWVKGKIVKDRKEEEVLLAQDESEPKDDNKKKPKGWDK